MQDSHLNYGDDFLRFGFQPSPSGQVDPVVQILWEPTPKAVERLAEAKATEAQLFVVVESRGDEQSRLLVPLEAGRWFVSLSTPGVSNIHATIVWSDDPKDRSAKRAVMSKGNRGYYELNALGEYRPVMLAIDEQIQAVKTQLEDDGLTEDQYDALIARREQLRSERDAAYDDDYETVIRPDLFDTRQEDRGPHQLGRARLGVDVPAQMFADGDSWWITRKLGGLLFKESRDQCQLRRRALFTAIGSPLLLIGGIVAASLVFLAVTLWLMVCLALIAVLNLWGTRNLDYGLIFTLNRFLDSPAEIWADAKPSRWWTKETKLVRSTGWTDYTYQPRHDIFYLINPVTLAAAVAVVGVEMLFGVDGWQLITPFVFIAAVVAIITLIGVYFDRREQAIVKEEPVEVVRQQVLSRYSAVAVNRTSRPPTLRLRYLETKAKFCKPFAR